MKSSLIIKVKKVVIDDIPIWLLKIIHQEYRSEAFYKGHLSYTASNGFKLNSEVQPEVGGGVLLVRGARRTMDDTILIVRNGEYIEGLKIAVKEYNVAMAKKSGKGALLKKDEFIIE
jgi:hypothetical protein